MRVDLIAALLAPTLDTAFDESLNRNGLRAALCGLLVAVAAAAGVSAGWAALAVGALLAAYEAYLAGVGRDRRTARDSLYDWTGGALGAGCAWAWLAGPGWLAVALGAAAVGVTLARAWVAGRNAT